METLIQVTRLVVVTDEDFDLRGRGLEIGIGIGIGIACSILIWALETGRGGSPWLQGGGPQFGPYAHANVRAAPRGSAAEAGMRGRLVWERIVS